jgi:hypothetical protein
MMTPQHPQGEEEAAKVDLMAASKMLLKVMGALGPKHPLGKASLTAYKAIAGEIGKDEESTEELQPAMIKQLLQGVSGPGQGAGAGGPPPGAPPMPPGGGGPPTGPM